MSIACENNHLGKSSYTLLVSFGYLCQECIDRIEGGTASVNLRNLEEAHEDLKKANEPEPKKSLGDSYRYSRF